MLLVYLLPWIMDERIITLVPLWMSLTTRPRFNVGTHSTFMSTISVELTFTVLAPRRDDVIRIWDKQTKSWISYALLCSVFTVESFSFISNWEQTDIFNAFIVYCLPGDDRWKWPLWLTLVNMHWPCQMTDLLTSPTFSSQTAVWGWKMWWRSFSPGVVWLSTPLER